MHSENSDDGGLCPSLTYSLKRLVRGLASSRAGARQGFSLALTELLLTFSIIPTSELLSLVDQNITLGSAGNQETRDFYLGRIFSALILCRSGRICDLSSQQLSELVQKVLSYCANKLALREICFQTIISIVKALPFAQVRDDLWPVLSDSFVLDGALLSPEHISLAIVLQRVFKVNGAKPPSAIVRNILSSRHFASLVLPLKESVRVHPRIHSVWHDFLRELIPKDKWSILWKAVVEENLFASSKQQHQYLGFQLFDYILRHISQAYHSSALSSSPSSVPSASERLAPLFTPRFIQCLASQLSSKSKPLFKCASHTRSVMVECAKLHPSIAFAIVNLLVGGGDSKYDEQINSQLVAGVLKSLDVTGLEAHVKALINKLSALCATTDDSDEGQKSTLRTMRWVVEQLYATARHAPVSHRPLIMPSILTTFVQHGFFKFPQKTSVPGPIAVVCAQRLFSLLGDLSKPQLTLKPKSNAEEAKIGETEKVWLFEMYGYIKSHVDQGAELLEGTYKDISSLQAQIVKLYLGIGKKLQKTNKLALNKEQFSSLQMLAAYLGILLLPEKNDALPVVQDFLKCAQDLLLDKPVAATTEKALNVLLEILLSLLSKQSNLTRDLVGLVFGSFCEVICVFV